jgi:hypothetical protein
MKLYITLYLLFFSTILFAEFSVGDTLPKITLADQYEKQHQVNGKDKLLILTFEKDIAEKVKQYLEVQTTDFLKKNQAKYISDISKMPSLVTSWIALPKMKKYPFPIMLIYDDYGRNFSQKKGKITVYRIHKNKIVSIQFIAPDKLSSIFDPI